MKKIVLVARKNIINPSTQRIHNDLGLKALDGIQYGRPRQLQDDVDPLTLWNEMRREFEAENPNFRADRYAIQLENGQELDCTDRLRMQTANRADENYQKLAALFPNAVTETINENGEVVRAIDKDVLMQEISCKVVDGPEERYQFTWPDKKKSILLANAPISATLRPCREESVDFDTTENLYIEGDNLDVLKLLQETYLGKIKMIYIDPPYNTGNDFVYEDDFAENAQDYLANSGQFDAEGNRLVQNTESNGRFHTDWLNMIYPRLRIAKDFLSDDGVIFISIDDNEYHSVKTVADEIFGQSNYIATIVRNTNSSKNQSLFISVSHEYCVVYARNIEVLKIKHADNKWGVPKNNVDEYVNKVKQLQKSNMTQDEITEELKALTKYPRFIDFTNYWYFDKRGLYSKGDLGGVPNGSKVPLFNPLTGKDDPIPPGGFRFSPEKIQKLVEDDRIHFHTDGSLPRMKRYLSENLTQRPKSIMSDDQRPDANLMQEFNTPFDNPKQLSFISRITSIVDKDAMIMDFFSGSATTAHAVMQLNAEDGGHRKFIMVQLPEKTDEKSEAYKAGYKTICEIGKERIRRAGAKIKNESQVAAGFDNLQVKMAYQDEIMKAGAPAVKDLDVGFRVLKLDSSNMKDVYYTPTEYSPSMFESLADNIKEDRTPEDLLFQVMLDLGILLSSKIEETTIAGKKVFSVADKFLIACFDADLTDEVITEIAKQKPYYFVTRDHSMASDSVATNFDQIFATYSPDTVRKVL